MNLLMNWISDWFGPRKPAADEHSLAHGHLAALRREQSINYSPQLIGRLCGDHAALLAMYQSVVDMLQQQRYAQIPAALGSFKSKFDVHILNENLRFYCYLEQKLRAQPAELTTVKEFRREMNVIARGVVNFVRQYQTTGVSAANQQGFADDLRQIGALLVQRIQREEEDLYTLYAP